MRLWDCSTQISIAVFEGDPKSVYSLSHSPLASISADTILRHPDSDAGGSLSTLNTKLDWFLSSEVLSISKGTSHDPSRRYCIQGTVLSSKVYVPLLWLPLDTSKIQKEAFCSMTVAFGCSDGQVIILDLTKLNMQEIDIM